MARLSDAQVRAALAGLPGWSYEDGAISKRYSFANFAEAMKFVNRVADLAEGMDHHPDITINYNAVLLTLSTHSEGGVTEKDVTLAGKIEDAAGAVRR
jgi:4a-hydroxytetrahydrobiopterin dehydratase